jgi:hypothetical protein
LSQPGGLDLPPNSGGGPEPPRSSEGNAQNRQQESRTPPNGSGTSMCHPKHWTRGAQHSTGGPGPPHVLHHERGRERERESSTRRLAHQPHKMRVVEACSATAGRGAAFVRQHYCAQVTKAHSVAAGATRACRSIKWRRRHGSPHHITYTACYATGLEYAL